MRVFLTQCSDRISSFHCNNNNAAEWDWLAVGWHVLPVCLGFPTFSHILHVKLIDSTLAIVWIVLCCPVMDWRTVQSVPRHLSIDIWDWLQPPWHYYSPRCWCRKTEINGHQNDKNQITRSELFQIYSFCEMSPVYCMYHNLWKWTCDRFMGGQRLTDACGEWRLDVRSKGWSEWCGATDKLLYLKLLDNFLLVLIEMVSGHTMHFDLNNIRHVVTL